MISLEEVAKLLGKNPEPYAIVRDYAHGWRIHYRSDTARGVAIAEYCETYVKPIRLETVTDAQGLGELKARAIAWLRLRSAWENVVVDGDRVMLSRSLGTIYERKRRLKLRDYRQFSGGAPVAHTSHDVEKLAKELGGGVMPEALREALQLKDHFGCK